MVKRMKLILPFGPYTSTHNPEWSDFRALGTPWSYFRITLPVFRIFPTDNISTCALELNEVLVFRQ